MPLSSYIRSRSDHRPLKVRDCYKSCFAGTPSTDDTEPKKASRHISVAPPPFHPGPQSLGFNHSAAWPRSQGPPGPAPAAAQVLVSSPGRDYFTSLGRCLLCVESSSVPYSLSVSLSLSLACLRARRLGLSSLSLSLALCLQCSSHHD